MEPERIVVRLDVRTFTAGMTRETCGHQPEAFWQAIFRAIAGSPVFFDDRDRYRLNIIQEKRNCM